MTSSSPWPPRDVVRRLADAVDHLLHDHDCDAHGHEEVKRCLDEARTWLGDEFVPADVRDGRICPAPRDDGSRPPTSIGSNELRTCWCVRCLNAPEHGLANPALARMILCPACGNKRCPRATDHRFACTGSNEPGQFGSRYGEYADEAELIALRKVAECARAFLAAELDSNGRLRVDLSDALRGMP